MFHLEAEHPELVRGRVELWVQRRLLLLLVEVLLVRLGEGERRSGRGGLFFWFLVNEKREETRVSKRLSQFAALSILFSFFCLRAEINRQTCDAGGKKSLQQRMDRAAVRSSLFLLWRLPQTNSTATWRSTLSSRGNAPTPRRCCSRHWRCCTRQRECSNCVAPALFQEEMRSREKEGREREQKTKCLFVVEREVRSNLVDGVGR